MSQDPLAPDHVVGPFARGEVLQAGANEFAYFRCAALVVQTEVLFRLGKFKKVDRSREVMVELVTT